MKKQILFYSLLGLLTAGTVAGIAAVRIHQNMMSSDTANENRSNHSGHSTNHMDMPHHNSDSDDRDGDLNKNTTAKTQAKLTIDRVIDPQKNIILKIDITDKQGKAVTDFEIFQEKLMHLIVVSDDLTVFNHVHPEYQNNGRFTVETSFPQGGNYTIFSDYKPKGESEEVSVLRAKVTGNSNPSVKADITTIKTIDNTRVDLSFLTPKIKAGKISHLIFKLTDTLTKRSPQDLQPYLGELGHLVILKQSSPLTKNDYIHAHATKDSPTGEIHFMTEFPRSGRYKIWGQFNRNGKIIVADFWVEVTN